MSPAVAGSFAAHLKALREAAGYTQDELATIAGLSVHAISALERGERRRPHLETVRALSVALDLSGPNRDALLRSARAPSQTAASDELSEATLPLAPTSLLGRDADLQTLQDWLADPAARLITLIGPGGAGKTRLGLELARATAASGSARVVYVPLAAIRNSVFVAPAIGGAFGLADVTTPDMPNRVREACRNRPTLLVLDNFEHVLEAAPLVADLLTSAASLRLVVTSRAPLRVRGEREYSVGPLALEPDAIRRPIRERPARAGGTRGARPSWPRSVGARVRGGTPDIDQCAAQRHRSRACRQILKLPDSARLMKCISDTPWCVVADTMSATRERNLRMTGLFSHST